MRYIIEALKRRAYSRYPQTSLLEHFSTQRTVYGLCISNLSTREFIKPAKEIACLTPKQQDFIILHNSCPDDMPKNPICLGMGD